MAPLVISGTNRKKLLLKTPMTISNQDSNPLDPNPEKGEKNFRTFIPGSCEFASVRKHVW